MNTQTKTLFYRVGRIWHFRIISQWDDSEMGKGFALKKRDAEKKASERHQELRTKVHP